MTAAVQRSRPSLKVTSVTIGTSPPRELARFYADLLEAGDRERPTPSGRARTGRLGSDQTACGWDRADPQLRVRALLSAPVWPTEEGQQTASQHLDIRYEDLEAAVEWAESLGARLATFQPQDRVRVMIDPDGKPFYLFR